MEKFIFTFGAGQENAGKCQPIYAENTAIARKKMFELHGSKWAFQYTGEKWEQMKKDPNRSWLLEEELPAIYCTESYGGKDD